MNQRANVKKIILIAIIVIVLILIIGISYLVFGTNTFKSNKELFFKYLGQTLDEEEGFIENDLKQYFNKQETTPYKNNGEFSVKINVPGLQTNEINNTKIRFSGEVNKSNSSLVQDISIDYSDEVKFPIKYKQTRDMVGIQTEYIGSKYVALERGNSDESIESILESLDSLSGIKNISLSKAEKNKIQNNYLKIIDKELNKEDFSKIEESNQIGYKLTLKGEKFKNILIKMLETLKEDQEVLDKINEQTTAQSSSSKISKSTIEDTIKNIERNSELENLNIEIIVYQKENKTNKIVISSSEFKLEIEKIKTGNDLQYIFDIEMYSEQDTIRLSANLRYSGLQLAQNVTQNYEIVLSSSENLEYRFILNNDIEFVQTTNIEEFSKENSLIITQLEKDKQEELMGLIGERIASVNETQMEELGVEQNPFLTVLTDMIGLYMRDQISKNLEIMEESNVEMFNQKFEQYQNTNLKGVTVKGLLSIIELNNETEEFNSRPRKIEEIHLDGEELEVEDVDIEELKEEISGEESYRVEFEKNENTGLIYRVVINKK